MPEECKVYDVICNYVPLYGGYLFLLKGDKFIELYSHLIYKYGNKEGTNEFGWIHSFCVDNYDEKQFLCREVAQFLQEKNLQTGSIEFLDSISRKEFNHFSAVKDKTAYIIRKFCDINKLDFCCRNKLMLLDRDVALRVIEKGFFFGKETNSSAVVMARIRNELSETYQ